jgi:hypothetical protein
MWNGDCRTAVVGPRLQVTGAEPDPRMATIARDRGVQVEVASFEEWDPRDRHFDLLISAQAWHWLDPVLAADKAAEISPRRWSRGLLLERGTARTD